MKPSLATEVTSMWRLILSKFLYRPTHKVGHLHIVIHQTPVHIPGMSYLFRNLYNTDDDGSRKGWIVLLPDVPAGVS